MLQKLLHIQNTILHTYTYFVCYMVLSLYFHLTILILWISAWVFSALHTYKLIHTHGDTHTRAHTIASPKWLVLNSITRLQSCTMFRILHSNCHIYRQPTTSNSGTDDSTSTNTNNTHTNANRRSHWMHDNVYFPISHFLVCLRW